MEYRPAALAHADIFENFIDTQQYHGHTTEGGPLPAYLLTRKFDETPDTFDAHAYYDFSRRTIADFRPDPPLFESESPRDTRGWSKTRMNVRTTGTRSGADPAAHPEMFLGFMDEDTRTPGDDHFPAWRIGAQMAARARYLKPTEPVGATHLSEGVPGDIEPETARAKKLQEARARVKRNLRIFGRSIENDQARAGRDWAVQPCAGASQSAEEHAGGARTQAPARDDDALESEETAMRSQRRAEYNPRDEKRGRVGSARRGAPGGAATLAAAHACAVAPGGGAADVIERESIARDAAPARIDASAAADAGARAMRHSARGASEPQGTRAGDIAEVRGGASIWHLARDMAAVVRAAEGDIYDDGAAADLRPRAWHLDDGDPLALLHRATAHDAERARDILDIATEIARRGVNNPWSAPHVAVRGDGSLGRALGWSGGAARAAAVGDIAEPAYLIIDAHLMKRACGNASPREVDLIRRQMLTDAKRAPGSEHALATAGAIVTRFAGAVHASSHTARDIEAGADALELHNARALRPDESAPASWHRGAARNIAAPEFISAPARPDAHARAAAPRGGSLPASALASVMRATRTDSLAAGSTRRAAPNVSGRTFSQSTARRGAPAEWADPLGERERAPGGARLGLRVRRATARDMAEPALDF